MPLAASNEALRKSEEQFRTLADSIPQLAWTARPDGHIYWYNRRWYEYTGTTLEQMAGWGWRVPLLVGSMLIPFLLLLRRSLAETDEFKARLHHPGTSEIWRTVIANWRLMILGMMLSITTTVTFYLITADDGQGALKTMLTGKGTDDPIAAYAWKVGAGVFAGTVASTKSVAALAQSFDVSSRCVTQRCDEPVPVSAW